MGNYISYTHTLFPIVYYLFEKQVLKHLISVLQFQIIIKLDKTKSISMYYEANFGP